MRIRKHGTNDLISVMLFVLFLVALVVALKGLSWCVGGICDVGTSYWLD